MARMPVDPATQAAADALYQESHNRYERSDLEAAEGDPNDRVRFQRRRGKELADAADRLLDESPYRK